MSDDRYDKTRHLNLPLYTDDTPMDPRDGYNEAMRVLDKKIMQLETLIRENKGASR